MPRPLLSISEATSFGAAVVPQNPLPERVHESSSHNTRNVSEVVLGVFFSFSKIFACVAAGALIGYAVSPVGSAIGAGVGGLVGIVLFGVFPLAIYLLKE